MYQAHILSGGIDVIEGLAPEWTALCDRSETGQPFLRPEWFTAFVRNFKTDVQLLTLRRDGKLQAVLPLTARRSAIHGLPVSALQAIFNLNTPRFDLVHAADEQERPKIVETIWNALQKLDSWDAFETKLVKSDSWLRDLVESAQSQGNLTGIWQMDSAPFITLPPRADAADYLQGSRKHFGKELDRRLRRLGELGNVEFSVSREYSASLIWRYLELEKLGWKGDGGTAAILDPRAAGLHCDFARAIGKRGKLHAYELTLDGQTIAMSLNIQDGSTMFHWKTSYDEAFSRYSPGNLLFKKLFDDCVEYGVVEIDLLSPSTLNKRVWATGEREHVAFYCFKRGLIGRVVWTWKFAILSRLRKVKSNYPRIIRLWNL